MPVTVLIVCQKVIKFHQKYLVEHEVWNKINPNDRIPSSSLTLLTLFLILLQSLEITCKGFSWSRSGNYEDTLNLSSVEKSWEMMIDTLLQSCSMRWRPTLIFCFEIHLYVICYIYGTHCEESTPGKHVTVRCLTCTDGTTIYFRSRSPHPRTVSTRKFRGDH